MMSKDDLKDYAAILLKISSAEQAVTSPHPRSHSVKSPPVNSGAVSNTSTKPTCSKAATSSTPPIPESILLTSTAQTSLSAEDADSMYEEPQDTPVTKFTDKQRFVTFFKILVLYMVRSTPEQKERIVIHRNIKALVAECTRECPDDESLVDTLEVKLRCYVGEHAWKLSQDTFSTFSRRRQIL